MSVIEEIAAERKRQIETEGFSTAHDDEHKDGEMALAAACYATPVNLYQKQRMIGGVGFRDPWPWPWSLHWDKRHWNDDGRLVANKHVIGEPRRRMLIKAAALLVAEIERLDRLGNTTGGTSNE